MRVPQGGPAPGGERRPEVRPRARRVGKGEPSGGGGRTKRGGGPGQRQREAAGTIAEPRKKPLPSPYTPFTANSWRNPAGPPLPRAHSSARAPTFAEEPVRARPDGTARVAGRLCSSAHKTSAGPPRGRSDTWDPLRYFRSLRRCLVTAAHRRLEGSPRGWGLFPWICFGP